MAYKRKKKEFFFPSVHMKMNWTFNYLKVMRRINQSCERRKGKKKKQERKKAKMFFLIIFFLFLYVYMKMNLSFIYLKVMRWISQSSDFILILSKGQDNVLEIRLNCEKWLLTRHNKWKMAIVKKRWQKSGSKLY